MNEGFNQAINEGSNQAMEQWTYKFVFPSFDF
jgi:hypothetical protein